MVHKGERGGGQKSTKMGRHGLCMPPKKEIELGNLKVIKKDLVDRNTKIKLLFFFL